MDAQAAAVRALKDAGVKSGVDAAVEATQFAASSPKFDAISFLTVNTTRCLIPVSNSPLHPSLLPVTYWMIWFSSFARSNMELLDHALYVLVEMSE